MPLRILVTLIEPPDPTGNASARWYFAFLGELCRRGHTITALATAEKPEAHYQLEACRSWPNFSLRLFPVPRKRSLLDKAQHLLFPFRGQFSSEFRRAVRQELGSRPDVVHLEQTWCGWLPGSRTRGALLNVHYLRSIDTNAMPSGSLLAKLNHHLATRAEKQLIRKFRDIRVLSGRLGEEVRKINQQARVHEITFGMPTTSYEAIPPSPHDQPTIGIMGNMNWYPSYSAARILMEEIWPLVKARLPEARLLVFGWAAGKLSPLAGEGVELIENAPEITPLLARLDVFVCPNFAATGTKTKIIEAMLYGIPVATTLEGLEGLNATPGVHAEVGADASELAERVVAMLQDPERRKKMSAAARAWILEQCSPRKTVDQLEEVYQKIARAPEAP